MAILPARKDAVSSTHHVSKCFQGDSSRLFSAQGKKTGSVISPMVPGAGRVWLQCLEQLMILNDLTERVQTDFNSELRLDKQKVIMRVEIAISNLC